MYKLLPRYCLSSISRPLRATYAVRGFLPNSSGGADVGLLRKVTCSRVLVMSAQCLRRLTSSSLYLTARICGQGNRLSGEWSPSRLSYQSPTLPAAVPSLCHLVSNFPISPVSVVIGFFLRSPSIGSSAR